MTNNERVAAIKTRQYDIYDENLEKLGLFKEDTLSVTIAGTYVDLNNVDSIPGTLKSTVIGWPVTAQGEIFAVSPKFFQRLLDGQVDVDTDGVNTAIKFGLRRRESQEFMQSLLLHPSGVPLSDRSGDLLMNGAYFKADALAIQSSKTQYQATPVTITTTPDLDADVGESYAIFGDPALSQVTPIAMMISTDKYLSAPYKTLRAITVGLNARLRVYAHRIQGTESGETAELTNTYGLTADDNSIAANVDVTDIAHINVGDILVHTGAGPGFNKEFLYVKTKTVVTSTNLNLVLVRGSFNSTLNVIALGQTFDIIPAANLAILEWRNYSEWASSDATKATVGNTYAETENANKAVIDAIAAGSTNITTTFRSVPSKNLAVTVEV